MIVVDCVFQSTHPRKVWPCDEQGSLRYFESQSTHPRRVWLHDCQDIRYSSGFNPHTHAGCDFLHGGNLASRRSFNPHTHAGCDNRYKCNYTRRRVSIHTPTQGVTLSSHRVDDHYQFQSTHPRRVWHSLVFPFDKTKEFQSTHPRRVWLRSPDRISSPSKFQSTHPRRVWPVCVTEMRDVLHVSIHTPTQGVTYHNLRHYVTHKFQSTHPRRVWQSEPCNSFWRAVFQSTHPRRVWPECNIILSSSVSFNPHTHAGCDIGGWSNVININVSIHTPTQGVTPLTQTSH